MSQIVNLKTDLKSLRYGNDRRGGGSSGQPYITNSIPRGEGPGLGDYDFLVRGGSLLPGAVANDVSRLSQMLFDLKSPNGVLFTAKQNILSRSGVNIMANGESSKLPLNNGIYLPSSTLAQAAVNPLGGHLLKQGINPTFDTSEAAARGNVGGILSFLTGNSLPLSNPIYFSTTAFEERITNENSSRLIGFYNNKILEKTSTPLLYDYSGGPNSTVGVGRTSINMSPDQRTGKNNKNAVGEVNIITLTDNEFENKTPTIREDFRKKISKDPILAPDYTNPDLIYEKRVNLGNAGAKNITKSYVKGNNEALDKINALPLYKSSNVDTNKDINDLCKFRIGVISNDDPSQKTYIHFRAFLDAMDDSYTADWQPQKFSGRAENLYNYHGFDRKFNLAWTVAAQSKQELIPMYQKLNYLASVCAPDYSNDGYMRGNLITLTVGGYLYEQVGIMAGINYTVPMESPWEIAINETGDSDPSVKELPFIIKVSGFNFIPIHDFVPNIQKNFFRETNQKGSNVNGDVYGFGPERYIALSNGTGFNNNNYDETLSKNLSNDLSGLNF